jgi:hypothetical protein
MKFLKYLKYVDVLVEIISQVEAVAVGGKGAFDIKGIKVNGKSYHLSGTVAAE